MAEHGTTWENFAPHRADESHPHAWSAHPLYHLMQIVGGITQSAPAWKEITFRPTFYGDHSQTVVPTPNGPIESSWKKDGTQIRVELKLPPATQALVILPGQLPRKILAGKTWILKATNVDGFKAI
jgi:hypothetical protein